MIDQIIPGRTLAFNAFLKAWKGELYLQDFFEQQRRRAANEELNLAQEIAYGTARHLNALAYQAQQLSAKKQLRLKRNEKALLYTALYQAIYMDHQPLYAVANEAVKLAKCQGQTHFAAFLNALLRKLADGIPILPSAATAQAWSTRFSLPQVLIETWLKTYGLEATRSILTAFQSPAPLFVRRRAATHAPAATHSLTNHAPSACNSSSAKVETSEQANLPANFYRLKKGVCEDQLKNSLDYIQNPTPYQLIELLSQGQPAPEVILDLCAAPGGKLIALHDLFPNAQLSANDVSVTKIERLQENLTRLAISAETHLGRAELFPTTRTYPLVILDVPCSNSGLLHKHPEARWRLETGVEPELLELQQALLAHAAQLTALDGEIWYLTCSILPQENSAQVDAFCQRYGWSKRLEKIQLPTSSGWDGGYACALRRVS